MFENFCLHLQFTYNFIGICTNAGRVRGGLHVLKWLHSSNSLLFLWRPIQFTWAFSFTLIIWFIIHNGCSDSDGKSSSSDEKPVEEKPKKDQPPKKKKKVELSLREEIELEMKNGSGEPPEVCPVSHLVSCLFRHWLTAHLTGCRLRIWLRHWMHWRTLPPPMRLWGSVLLPYHLRYQTTHTWRNSKVRGISFYSFLIHTSLGI